MCLGDHSASVPVAPGVSTAFSGAPAASHIMAPVAAGPVVRTPTAPGNIAGSGGVQMKAQGLAKPDAASGNTTPQDATAAPLAPTAPTAATAGAVQHDPSAYGALSNEDMAYLYHNAGVTGAAGGGNWAGQLAADPALRARVTSSLNNYGYHYTVPTAPAPAPVAAPAAAAAPAVAGTAHPDWAATMPRGYQTSGPLPYMNGYVQRP